MATPAIKLARAVAIIKEKQRVLIRDIRTKNKDDETKFNLETIKALDECCEYSIKFLEYGDPVPAAYWPLITEYQRIMTASVGVASNLLHGKTTGVASLIDTRIGPSDEEVEKDRTLKRFVPMRNACYAMIDGFDGCVELKDPFFILLHFIADAVKAGLDALKEASLAGVERKGNIKAIMGRLNRRMEMLAHGDNRLTGEEEKLLYDVGLLNARTKLSESLSALFVATNLPVRGVDQKSFIYYLEMCDLWLNAFAPSRRAYLESSFYVRVDQLRKKVEDPPILSDFAIQFAKFAYDMTRGPSTLEKTREVTAGFNSIVKGVKVMRTIAQNRCLVVPNNRA